MRKKNPLVHGPEYKSWCSMKQRCNNPNCDSYHNYGGRGITYCKSWESFSQFFADMGRRPPGTSLERKDVNKGYSPDNCVWATKFAQARSTRRTRLIEIDGVAKCAVDWEYQTGVSKKTILDRHYRGIRGRDLLQATPLKPKKIAVTHEGKTQSLPKWAKEKGVPYRKLYRCITMKSMALPEALKHLTT